MEQNFDVCQLLLPVSWGSEASKVLIRLVLGSLVRHSWRGLYFVHFFDLENTNRIENKKLFKNVKFPSKSKQRIADLKA